MNEHSSDFAVVSVAVEGPPEPPSGRPSVSQGPDRIALAWCGPPYDGGCMLTGFIIEMQTDDSEWCEIVTVVDSLAYTVKNVTTGTNYKFRVRAENIHGRSEPSASSDEVRISLKEDLIEDFSNKAISIRSGGDFKSRFNTLEELGKGRFGVVYKVHEKESRQIMAAKIIRCIKSRDRLKVQEEISIMKSLQHPKLLQLAATFENPREIIMVMEYITGGELFERVVADDFTLTERDCILFLRQICEGVDYMHSQSIVHLDLKPENIMCHTRTSHQIKIIDFGLAQRLNTDSPVRVLFGTPEFIPPEIINYEPIGFQSDMWSVGVICYVLLSGLSPFMGDSDAETFANITRADYDYDDEAFDAVSQEAKDFISNLLVHRKEERLTAKQCLEAKWLTQYHDENLSNNKICTDKLKKFIIRRKWQKTGNAIRALGRMANLSASRRNSAVSTAGSIPNSPRPSISGGSILNPNISSHMTSLNEEEDDFDSTLPSAHSLRAVVGMNAKIIRDKTQCSERSDSGFSECSNCSGGGNIPCMCPQTILEKSKTVQGENERTGGLNNELSVAVPHEILKIKLEEIAKSQTLDKIGESDDDGSERYKTPVIHYLQKLEIKEDLEENRINCTSLENITIEIPIEHRTNTHKKPTEATSSELITAANKDTSVTIMASDFTNTIKMRKKSLENNLSRDKMHKSKAAIIEPCGKVSMLKNKFSQVRQSSTSSINSTRTKTAKMSSSTNIAKSKDVFDRLAYSNKSIAASTGVTKSLPGSPVPFRSTASMRLSGRVREATERLSQPKTITSPEMTISIKTRRLNSTKSTTEHKYGDSDLTKKSNENSFLPRVRRDSPSSKGNNLQNTRNYRKEIIS